MRVNKTHLEDYAEDSVIMKTNRAIIAVTSKILNKKSSLLRKYDLSFQQYTILRTLSLAEGKPASIKSLTEEMVDKMPNTSRLVTKLEKKGFLIREVSPLDRRQVEIIITKTGKEIFKNASQELNKFIISTYKSLNESKLTMLLETLLKLKETSAA